MKMRFLAVIDPQRKFRSEKLADLKSQFPFVWSNNRNTLHVFTDYISPTISSPSRFVVGNLFGIESHPTHINSSSNATSIIESLDNRAILQKYWGDYIYFSSAGPDEVQIIRDPTGLRTCFWIATDGIWIVASDAEVIWRSGLVSFGIDWKGLAQYLYLPAFRTAQTAITELNELLPGHSLSISRSSVVPRNIWSPWDFTDAGPVTSPAELAQVVTDCVTAWSRCYGPKVLAVSGGFDSSVLAVILSTESDRPLMFTMKTDEPDGDETVYTDVLAKTLGTGIAVYGFKFNDSDLVSPVAGHLPWPCSNPAMQSLARARRKYAEAGVEAFITGVGGDNVFYYTQSAAPLADRLLSNGGTKGLFGTLNDVCTLNDCSYTEACQATLRSVLRRHKWRGTRGFLSEDCYFDSNPFHPWTSPVPKGLPGKVGHIASIVRATAALDGLNFGDMDVIAPLLSQPIVQTCLRIPSWKWVEGGSDRAVARAAFGHLLPTQIRRRRSKGGPDSYVVEMIESNRRQIRQLLLDGTLSSGKLLNRKRLEMALSDGSALKAPAHLELSMLIEAELWASKWTSRATQCGRSNSLSQSLNC